MWRLAFTAFASVLFLASAAHTQPAREITFFSNPGFTGARFTVTGPRENLDIPYAPRSALISGGGAWEVCTARAYRGECLTLNQNERDLRLRGPRAQSARPVGPVGPPPVAWREVARLNVRDRAEQDTARISSREPYSAVMVCAERNTVRIRRASVQFQGAAWQRLFLPLALRAGECSKAIDLIGGNRRLTAVRFEYEAWSPGWRGGTIVVRARPVVEKQPR